MATMTKSISRSAIALAFLRYNRGTIPLTQQVTKERIASRRTGRKPLLCFGNHSRKVPIVMNAE